MEKKLLVIALISTLIFSCKQNNEITKEPENNDSSITPSLVGTWERTSYYNYQDGKVSDTFLTNSQNRHIKLYSPEKVMWCRQVSADSTEWFGYGSYSVKDSTLTEVLEYGSKAMSVFIERNPKFVFHCIIDKDKFSQIQIDDDGNPLFAENYVRIE